MISMIVPIVIIIINIALKLSIDNMMAKTELAAAFILEDMTDQNIFLEKEEEFMKLYKMHKSLVLESNILSFCIGVSVAFFGVTLWIR